MIFKKNLVLNYHQQDKDQFCGAACAQMILHQMGTPLMVQKDLFEYIQSNNTPGETVDNWNSGPTGLTAAMNNFNPLKETRDFILYDHLTEDTISRKIVWTIFHYEVAPIALVFAGQHWVAVKGFQTDQTVKSAVDGTYGIIGFFINDPRPIISSGPPPPHASGDRCGDSLKFGIDNQHVSYDAWKDQYMVPNQLGDTWANKYIAICDPEPAPKQKGKDAKVIRLGNGEKMINKEIVAKYAEKCLVDLEMSNNYNLKEVLNNVKSGDPVLVQRIDKKNEYYYLVPMQGSNKNVNALVSIDGRFGNYRESCFAKSIKNPLGYKPLNRNKILERLRDWLQHDHNGMILEIYPRAVLVSPIMVWKPCQESYTPYMPFYLIHVGANMVYVRIDGEVYGELTQKERGG